MSRLLSGFQAFLDELRRRHVLRIASAYAVGGFVVLEASSLVFEGLRVPGAVYRALTVLVLVGFPVSLVLAWFFEWTRGGIRREPEVVEGESPGAPGSGGAVAPAAQAVRAFAIVGLGVVIALVGTGLSLPYVYSRDAVSGQDQVSNGAENVQLASSQARVATMAVLPFASLTGEEDAGFADGLAEDLTAALAQVEGLDVVSRTTSEAYRGANKTAREIGVELGVGYILEGTVRRSDDVVRVTVQLIDAATDRHVWANTYDRDLSGGDVFATQTQLTREIVAAIRTVLRPAEKQEAERSLLAGHYIASGNRLLEMADPHVDNEARSIFEQALAADSQSAAALAGIGQTMLLRAVDAPPALRDSAEVYARRAIEMNPQSIEGYLTLSSVLILEGDIDSAVAALRPALEYARGQQLPYDWQARVGRVAPEATEAVRRRLAELELVVVPPAGEQPPNGN